LDPEYARDLFQHFRPVEVRRMFGGAGIMADGITFAIAFDGVIFLKTDDETRPAFEREGSKPFIYPLMKQPGLRKTVSSFWRLPERLYDDPDELAAWAAQAFAIAQRKKVAPKARGGAAKTKRAAPTRIVKKPATRKSAHKKPPRKSRKGKR
jgi:DNA transformation protein